MARARAESKQLSSSPSSKKDSEGRGHTPASTSFTRGQGPLQTGAPVVGLDASDQSTQNRHSVQPKLTVNDPDDKYEREAERIADAVMRMPDPESTLGTQENVPSDRIQRMCSRCLQRFQEGKPLNCEECEIELQRREEAGDKGAKISGGVERTDEVAREPGKPLPEGTRSFFEERMGADFSGVRVHIGGEADRAAQSINARAYTLGSDVVMRSGEYRPGTQEGKRLLAHELTHVLQQSGTTSRTIRRQNYPRPLKGDGTMADPIGAGEEKCDCGKTTPYKRAGLDYIRGIAPLITRKAKMSTAPALVVAGVIADERGAQERYGDFVDVSQNAIVDTLPEVAIEVDQYFDIKHKLLNTLENDVGPANFKVRTALEIAREEYQEETKSTPANLDVSRIIDQLLTDEGTVHYTIRMVERAHTRFAAHVKSYPDPLAEAVYVSYFKQGDSYYQRFAKKRESDSSHRPCPGTAGCRYREHRDQIKTALGL